MSATDKEGCKLASPIDEFYDLEDLQLNLNPSSFKRETSWGNLGYWQLNPQGQIETPSDQLSYAHACSELAMQLANLAKLNQLSEDHVVLDTGFGCGDQLLVWHARYGVKYLYGINYSQSQTQLALNLVKEHGIQTYTLKQGDACDDKQWKPFPRQFDRILALDCIYHFNDKSRYLDTCAGRLKDQGILAISDLLLSKPIANPLHGLLLRLICKLSHIPYGNLMTLANYEQNLKALGLELTDSWDVSEHVFIPFGTWLDAFIKDLDKGDNAGKKRNWLKYKGTAWFLRWAYNKQILKYYLLQARPIK